MFLELSEGARQLLAEIMLAEASTPMVFDSSSFALILDHHNRLVSYHAIAFACLIPQNDRFLENPGFSDSQKTRQYIHDIVDAWIEQHTSTLKDIKQFIVSDYHCYVQELLEWEETEGDED